MLTPHTQKLLPLSGKSIVGGGAVKTVVVEDIDVPTVLTRPKRNVRREIRDLRATKKATEAIAGLTPDVELIGLTKGQFSLLNLLEAVIAITGPVHFTLSTWTAARNEILRLQQLQQAGQILSARWLVDLSFVRRDPEAAQQIRLAFGVDAIRIAQTHSKLALFTNDKWKLVLRTSMNLNMNPRLEDFTLSNDEELHAFFETILTDIWTKQKRSLADAHGREGRRFFRDEM